MDHYINIKTYERRTNTFCLQPEVRYFKVFQILRDKLKTSCGCNKHYCPNIKQRLEYHRKTSHSSHKIEPDPKVTLPLHEVLKEQPAYTSLCSNDNQCEHLLKLLDTDVDDDTSTTELRHDVIDLFKDFPDTENTNKTKQLKKALINKLVDRIENLIDYNVLDDDIIKVAIDNAINKVFESYPSKTDEMVTFVDCLRNKLVMIVKSHLKRKRGNNTELYCSGVSGDEPYQNKTFKDELNNRFKNYDVQTNTPYSKSDKDKTNNNLINDTHRILNDKTVHVGTKKTENDRILEEINPTSQREEILELENIRYKLNDVMKAKTNASRNNSRTSNYSTISGRDLQNRRRSNKTANRSYNPEVPRQDSIQPKSQTPQDDLINLYENYPIHAYTLNSKDLKDNNLINLVNDIQGILNDKMIPDVVKKITIDHILEELKSKYPISKIKEIAELEQIRSKILDKIKCSTYTQTYNYLSTSTRQHSYIINNDYKENKQRDNDIINKSITKVIIKMFNDFPILRQGTYINNNDNPMPKLIEDLNNVLKTNKQYNENKINTDIDNVIDKLSMQVPTLKKDVKLRQNVKFRLITIVNNVIKEINSGSTFNNYSKSNYVNSNFGSTDNFGMSGNMNTVNNFGNFPRAGIRNCSKLSQSESQSQVPIRKEKKSELRQILETSVYPQIENERKNILIERLLYDIEIIKRNGQHKTDPEIREELRKLIDNVPLWNPGAERDQVKYVNNLKNKLFDFIKNPTQDVSNISNYKEQNNLREPYEGILSVDNNSISTIFTDEYLAENLIREWVRNIKHEYLMKGVDKEDLIKSITDRIVPILQKNPYGKKIIIKGAILEILSYIPASYISNLKLQRLVNELVNTLTLKFRNKPNECCQTKSRTMFVHIYNDFSKIQTLKIVNEFLNKIDMAENVNLRDEIADLILYHSDSVSLDDEYELENDIIKKLVKNTDASERDILSIAKNISEWLCKNTEINSKTLEELHNDTIFPTSKSIAVFTSATDNRHLLQQSGAEYTKNEKQKLNDEEINYINKVSDLVRAWMETLPVQFNAPEERGFKESMISELAGQIMDIHKVDQIVNVDTGVTETNIKNRVYLWLLKFDSFDLEELVPNADIFIDKLKHVPVPDLTKSYRGTRQMMDNIKHMEGEKAFTEEYVPKGIDILKDEISIWVHDQQPDLFTFDKKSRNDKIHELAIVIQPKIAEKENENIIAQDIGIWLNKNLRNNANINELQMDLKDRVINLPQDATLRANVEEKIEVRRLMKEQTERQKNQSCCVQTDDDTTDLDRTMKDIISKFIEHNYKIDNPIARDAFNHLLKKELQILTPQSRQEVYNKVDVTDTFILPPEKLFVELEYIKIISDWLKNIPLEDHFKRPHNYERIDFILGLARTLSEVENERALKPSEMDYDMYTASLIKNHVLILPIPKEYKHIPHVELLVDQLLTKLDATREIIKIKKANGFADKSGINDENLGDFLEEFIRVHGNDIADDEVKMEAWSIRLIREVRKIVQEKGADVSKGDVYNQCMTVPKPGDETIQRFNNELIYIQTITEWMKNLPFKPLSQEENDNRKRMICDLSEYLAAKEVVTMQDSELTEHLKQWISELPLDRNREIVIPLLIEQLINRINRQHDDIAREAGKTKSTSKRKTSKCINKSNENPGVIVVDAVEKWSNSLPLEGCCNTVKYKCDAAKKMYQKIGEFNTDPGIYNDDLLYKTFLKDEIGTIEEQLPNGADIKVKNAKNDEKLLKTLVHAKAVAREKSAGENYKQKLEHTIDASIPNPVSNKQSYDPIFEIYKSRLADMFILENFDHGNDQVKAKYEKQIRNEIDKYFEGAQHKNATRLSKNEIYNELYSNLFKVPIPNETSTMDEVEKIKTRQVIDEWFEELPLKESDDITELLERDRKLDALTKRVHEIEKSSKSDDELLKEISKWSTTVPILPSEVNNINEYAENLKNKLKSTEKERKCVSEKDAKKKKDKNSKVKSKSTKQRTSDEESVCCPKSVTTNNADVGIGSVVLQKRNAADIIVEQVELWCSEIIPSEAMRNEVLRKIIVKISEINMDKTVFNDDILYIQTLDKEIDKILADFPPCCTLYNDQKKLELIATITSLKPLINEEKDKVNYIENLNMTVDREFSVSSASLEDDEDESKALKQDIVENYVQLNYVKDDENKQIHKQNIQDDVNKFLKKLKGDKNAKPLMKRNQIICELNKVPIPNESAITDKVYEIRMKKELNCFFKENSLNNVKNKPVEQSKTALAKRLTAIEASGHTEKNDKKMIKEIDRCCKKLGKELKVEKIEGFVNKLKENEHERRRQSSLGDPSNQFNSKTEIDAQEGGAVLPKCAQKSQECCPCDTNKQKQTCPRPYTKMQCDPKDDPFCYKYPKYCT